MVHGDDDRGLLLFDAHLLDGIRQILLSQTEYLLKFTHLQRYSMYLMIMVDAAFTNDRLQLFLPLKRRYSTDDRLGTLPVA